MSEADWNPNYEPPAPAPAPAGTVAVFKAFAANPMTTVAPEDAGRAAAVFTEAAHEEGYLVGVRKRFGAVTWTIVVLTVGAWLGTIELLETIGTSFEAKAGSIGASMALTAPLIKVFFPRVGAWAEGFFRRS